MMLRKILAIFCISLILLFNYGRIINYWGCELIQANNDTNTTCDCQKQSQDATTDAQQSSAQKTIKDKTEDLFSDNNNSFLAFSFRKKIISANTNGNFNLPAGFNKKIFQPPRF
jgi:hypothetical protein